MKLTELFLAELEREAPRSRRVLEAMPEGKQDWKPHDKSMAFGYLSEIVATIPSWIALAIDRDELDLNPPDGNKLPRTPMHTKADYLAGFDKAVADARAALQKTSDEYLQTPWKLLFGGKVVMENPRHVVIRDTIGHSAHHRGQMTVYLRLLDAKVPAVYGPSADDRSFA